jgi:acyl-CoA synthetase (AMP-forming)/AMP-acid ligase II
MTYLSPAPLYHAAPWLGVALTIRMGGTAIIMEHFDPEQFLALVERYRVTHTQLVPTMFSRMLKQSKGVRHGYDVSSLEIAIHAAAPCSVPVKEQMIECRALLSTNITPPPKASATSPATVRSGSPIAAPSAAYCSANCMCSTRL